MAGFALPAAFWSDFIEQHWEQEPIVWRGLHTPGIMTRDELFETIVAMPSRSQSDRFWVAKPSPVCGRDDYTLISLDHFGPKLDDRSLDGFFARVQQGLQARPMGINIHQLQLANPGLWFRLRQFIRGLIDGTGELPTQRWEIDTFFGTYHATPFGIHRDNASVFAFGILGQRTYYFWPPDTFQPSDEALATPDLTHIAPHLQHAQRVDLGPGDVVYWPSSHWHVVVSDGQPSAVVQISAYFGTRLSRLLARHVQRLLKVQLGQSDFQYTYARCGKAAELPRVLADAQAQLGRLWQDGLLNDELQRFWLTHLTADGFIAVPPEQADARLERDMLVALRASNMMAWRREVSGQLCIAANGLTRTVDDMSALSEMLTDLSTGTATTVAELVRRFRPDTAQAAAVEQTLEWLYRCRVLVPVTSTEQGITNETGDDHAGAS